jgi:hypothetical protein
VLHHTYAYHQSFSIMSRVHHGSKSCGSVFTDLTAMPDTCTDIDEVIYIEVPPINSVSDSSNLPLEFYVKGTPDYYPDLSGSEILLMFKVTHDDGTKLTDKENVGVVNNFAHAMFSQIDLWLNDQMVTNNNGLYPYRAYFETHLSYGPAAKNSWLQGPMYHADQHDAFEQTDLTAVPINVGYLSRAKYIAQSKTADVIFRPHLDMFMQERPVLNNVDIRLKLTRSTPEFSLMAGTEHKYKISITHAAMFVRCVKLNTAVMLQHKHVLTTNGKVVYPLRRVDMQTFTIGSGLLSHVRPNIITGQLPRRIIIAFTTNKALNGVYAHSYCRFRPYGVNRINLLVNGRSVPSRAYTPNFIDTNNSGVQYARCFNALSQVCKHTHTDSGNTITRSAYGDGYTMFAFNLSEDWGEDMLGLVREGTVQLEVRFAVPTPEVLNAIVYCEYEKTISIDGNGTVLLHD